MLRQFGSLSAQQQMLMAVWGLNDTGLVQKSKVHNSAKIESY